MSQEDLKKLACDGAVLLRFGDSKFKEDENLAVTPAQRQLGHSVPLNTAADYMLLIVARQIVLLQPDLVVGIHSFEELYGGRLMTETWTQHWNHRR
eukprot:Skav204123  [mRNA]  locus=scaffold5190:280699:280986:- [translate_table: standard]